ncbi:MAG: PorP/SprF family type IX secretion system membrane protein [Bacteroidota bacterium]
MKTKFYNKLILALMLIFSVEFSIGQDINFSQFYDLPILRNPSLAGLFDGDVRITSGFRNQWQSVTVPYKTIALGAEFKKIVSHNTGDFVTFGFQLTNDVAGDSKLSRTQVFPVINYHKSLSADKNTYLSAAFMGGPVMQQFDPTKLRFDDQYMGGSFSAANPTHQTFSNTSLTYWDPTVGLSFSSDVGENTNYYIAAGIFHFTKPGVSFQPQNDFRLNPKFVINAGITTMTNEVNRMTFYIDLFKQGGAAQGQGGVMMMHDLVQTDDDKKVSISGGLFYRMNDAIIPVIKLDYYKMSIGTTYDINISKLVPASQYRGGLEVTLSYKAFSPNHISDEAYKTRCPKFF